MNNCIFCRLTGKNSPDMFTCEGIDKFVYFWDINPVTPGHLIIVPKRHAVNFISLDESEYQELPRAILAAYEKIENTNLVNLYKKVLYPLASEQSRPITAEKSQKFLNASIRQLEKLGGRPGGYNHGVNDGEAAGQTVNHFHYHIFPRWKGDVFESRGGIRAFIKDKGSY